jgi:hypothetical protein
MAERNQHGAYTPDETLSLPRAVKNWRGVNAADIELANLGAYWIWASSFQLYGGDHLGNGTPLIDDDHRFRAVRQPSRDAAIAAACKHLRERMTGRDSTDARAILAWLDTLQPDQFDLFGAAA